MIGGKWKILIIWQLASRPRRFGELRRFVDGVTEKMLIQGLKELEKDVEEASKKLGRTGEETNFTVFVLHNKDKKKKGSLPKEMMEGGRYLAAKTVGDVWICYPWEAKYVDIISACKNHHH